MSKKLTPLILLSLVFVPFNTASAFDLCKAKVLRDITIKIDDQGDTATLKRGQFLDAITQYRVNKRTGETSFCSHGGECWPEYVKVGDAKFKALKLVNCKVGGLYDPNFPDDTEIIYSVDVVRSKNTASDLRMSDLAARLVEIGTCDACADNIAEFILKKPSSRCAKIAIRALEGDPVATRELVNDPNYCTWHGHW